MLNALRQSEENQLALQVGGQSQEIVLNALRQSEENQAAGAGRRLPGTGVLNALRQSEENQPLALEGLVVLERVLNALRQSEENQSRNPCLSTPPQRCSTPYGNQRKISLSPVQDWAGHWGCSTPYGNQRKIRHPSNPLPASLSRIPVLNALRQSEENQRCGGTTADLSSSAQRLTAIRGKSAPLFAPQPQSRLKVLNALRQSEENQAAP